MTSSVFQPRLETAEAVNWLANNDLKAFSYLGLVILGEATTYQLAVNVAEHSVSEAYQPVRAYPLTFEKGNFATVDRRIGASHKLTGFYTADRAEAALPVIGTLLEWSELFDYSLTLVLSDSAPKGAGGAPLNTLQILDGLRQFLTIGEMELPGYVYSDKHALSANNTRLKTLVALGIVDAKDEAVPIRILDPSYKGSRPLRLLKPGRQGFYQTVLLAKEVKPDNVWSAEQLINLARQNGYINDGSEADFTSALMRAVSANDPTRSPGVIEKHELKPTTYTISDRFYSMVHDLVERVIRVDKNKRFAKQAKDYATDVYNDLESGQRIAARGLTYSTYRNV